MWKLTTLVSKSNLGMTPKSAKVTLLSWNCVCRESKLEKHAVVNINPIPWAFPLTSVTFEIIAYQCTTHLQRG